MVASMMVMVVMPPVTVPIRSAAAIEVSGAEVFTVITCRTAPHLVRAPASTSGVSAGE